MTLFETDIVKMEMISFEDADIGILEEFQIKWRWTDTRWNKLPDDALKTIQPLTETKALELFQYSIVFFDETGLKESFFKDIEQVDTSSESSEIQQ